MDGDAELLRVLCQQRQHGLEVLPVGKSQAREHDEYLLRKVEAAFAARRNPAAAGQA